MPTSYWYHTSNSHYHEVSRTDYYLGELRKELKPQGIAGNNTIEDDWQRFPRHNNRLYDSRIRTPFVVFGPKEIEQFVQADLDLAARDGTMEGAARLYAGDNECWKMDEKTSE